jgi:hypothetical protein
MMGQLRRLQSAHFLKAAIFLRLMREIATITIRVTVTSNALQNQQENKVEAGE